MAATTTRCACGQYAPRRADALDPTFDDYAADEAAYTDTHVDRHDCPADYHGTASAPQAGEFEAWEAQLAAETTTEDTMPEQFSDTECAEIAAITANLRAAVDAAVALIDRLHAANREADAALADCSDRIIARAAEQLDRAGYDAPADYDPAAPIAAAVQRAEYARELALALDGEAVMPDRDSYSMPVRVDTLTIGYVQSRGAQTHAALDVQMHPIVLEGSAAHGYFYTRLDAKQAVVRAFIAQVRAGTFNPKGA